MEHFLHQQIQVSNGDARHQQLLAGSYLFMMYSMMLIRFELFILVAVCILPSKYTELLPRVQRRVQVQVLTGSPLNQVLNTPNLSLTSFVSSPLTLENNKNCLCSHQQYLIGINRCYRTWYSGTGATVLLWVPWCVLHGFESSHRLLAPGCVLRV